MKRLSLQVFYLWRHVLSTAPPFILWWSNLEILFAPLHRSSPFIGGLRCQAIQTEHGTYIAERTQKAVYTVRCLWYWPDKLVVQGNNQPMVPVASSLSLFTILYHGLSIWTAIFNQKVYSVMSSVVNFWPNSLARSTKKFGRWRKSWAPHKIYS
jgi:hypothetical protein